MSPLWPTSTHVALLEGKVFVRRDKSHFEEFSAALDDVQSYGIAAIAQALREIQTGPVKASKVQLTVFDGFARTLPVPWPAENLGEADWPNYVRTVFHARRIGISGQPVLAVDFARYGSLGLGFAVDRVWLDSTEAMLQQFSLRLDSLKTVSIAASHRRRLLAIRERGALLILDASSCALLAFQKGKLVAYEVEPVRTSALSSVRSLVGREAFLRGEIHDMFVWDLTDRHGDDFYDELKALGCCRNLGAKGGFDWGMLW